jgi:hypothetical protein
MRPLTDHEHATVCKALSFAIKHIDAMPDQEQYRGDRAAMARLLDDLDDAWLGERHRVRTRHPAKA